MTDKTPFIESMFFLNCKINDVCKYVEIFNIGKRYKIKVINKGDDTKTSFHVKTIDVEFKSTENSIDPPSEVKTMHDNLIDILDSCIVYWIGPSIILDKPSWKKPIESTNTVLLGNFLIVF